MHSGRQWDPRELKKNNNSHFCVFVTNKPACRGHILRLEVPLKCEPATYTEQVCVCLAADMFRPTIRGYTVWRRQGWRLNGRRTRESILCSLAVCTPGFSQSALTDGCIQTRCGPDAHSLSDVGVQAEPGTNRNLISP